MSNILLSSNSLIKYVFIIVKSVIVLVCYIYFDKKNNIKRNGQEYAAIFIFCDFYVIYDVIKKLKSKSVTASKSLIVILTVLLIINYISNSFMSFYSSFNG